VNDLQGVKKGKREVKKELWGVERGRRAWRRGCGR